MKIHKPHSILYLSKAPTHKGRLKRRAISSVISTVLLTSVMLAIALVVMGFASNMFSVESQSVEFNQAKSTMINFAGIIEQVSSNQGSSGYVLFNPKTGGPNFLSNIGTMTVTLSSDSTAPSTNITLSSGSYNTFNYKGGYLSSVTSKSYLRGAESMITYNNNSTLGSIYVEQANGSWIVLDYARIGVLNLGTFNFSTGINATGYLNFEIKNVIQIQFINITAGTFTGSGSINTVATCKNIGVIYENIPGNPGLSNYGLTITIELSPMGKSSTLRVDIPNNYDTIAVVLKSDVEVSMFGG